MIAKTHHMWSISGSETAVSETAISQLQNRSKYRILHSILQSKFRAILYLFGAENAIFCKFLYLGFCFTNLLPLTLYKSLTFIHSLTRSFDIQEITLTFRCGAI